MLARVGPLALTVQPLDSYTGKSQSCSPGVLCLVLCHPGPGRPQPRGDERAWPASGQWAGRLPCPPLTPPGPAGESIPIRLFLAGYELTPTMRDINKKFSVRYYLNLVLIDDEERRYFKQQVGVGPGRGRGRAGGSLCRLVQPDQPGRCLSPVAGTGSQLTPEPVSLSPAPVAAPPSRPHGQQEP